jgi:hypothetical protein
MAKNSMECWYDFCSFHLPEPLIQHGRDDMVEMLKTNFKLKEMPEDAEELCRMKEIIYMDTHFYPKYPQPDLEKEENFDAWHDKYDVWCDKEEEVRENITADKLAAMNLRAKGYYAISIRNKAIRQQYDRYMKTHRYASYDDPGYVYWEETTGYLLYGGMNEFLRYCINYYMGCSVKDVAERNTKYVYYLRALAMFGLVMPERDFENSLEMAKKYDFRSDKTDLLGLLDTLAIEYTYIEGNEAVDECYRWFLRYVPAENRHEAIRCAALPLVEGYLWHIFSYPILPRLEQEEAIRAFDEEDKSQGGILILSGNKFAVRLKDGGKLKAKDLIPFPDLIYCDSDRTWTYAQPHAQGFPYYYRRDGDYGLRIPTLAR